MGRAGLPPAWGRAPGPRGRPDSASPTRPSQKRNRRPNDAGFKKRHPPGWRDVQTKSVAVADRELQVARVAGDGGGAAAGGEDVVLVQGVGDLEAGGPLLRAVGEADVHEGAAGDEEGRLVGHEGAAGER